MVLGTDKPLGIKPSITVIFHSWPDAVQGRTSFGSPAAFTDQFKTVHSCIIRSCNDKHCFFTISLHCLNHGICIISEPEHFFLFN